MLFVKISYHMVYNSLWSANEKRRGQMIHPKELGFDRYIRRKRKKQRIRKGISLEIVFVFHTLNSHSCAATDAAEAVGYRYDRLDDGRSRRFWLCHRLSLQTWNQTTWRRRIGIQMGNYCQRWFSALWFDGGEKRQNRMTYAFPCRLAWDPSALVECWRCRTTGWPS